MNFHQVPKMENIKLVYCTNRKSLNTCAFYFILIDNSTQPLVLHLTYVNVLTDMRKLCYISNYST